MSIHSEIRRLRQARGWSQQRLADEVSRAEHLHKPLSWQTVQQWEREPDATAGKSTAPKRARLAVVAELLGTTVEGLVSGAPAQTVVPFDALSAAEAQLITLFRLLPPQSQRALIRAATTAVGHRPRHHRSANGT